MIWYKTAQKSTIVSGYFCKQIWCQQLSNIAQSGHTTGNPWLFQLENLQTVIPLAKYNNG